MISDDERREVAEDLRYEVDYPCRPVQYMEQFVGDLRQIIFSDFATDADYSEMFSRLADLIEPEPERTCHVVPMDASGSPPYRKSYFILNEMSDGCSECGYPFDTVNNGEPNYCPNCGAKVVSE